jgi:cysteine desulfurase
MHRVYLDNNATTPILPEVLDAMHPYLTGSFGNASSIHQQGQQARAAVEHAREYIADLIGAREAEIVFTSGGTEGDNLALFGLCHPGDHLITSTIEHHAVLNSAQRLEKLGVEVTYIPVNAQGHVDPDAVKKAIRANTKLISVMLANNETGVLQDLETIGKIAAEADVYFHTDAVQAIAKIPVDVNALRCDLLTLAGHKLHAPQGTGALYVRKGTILDPLFYGGRHERSRRAGTENLPGIVGLGRAAELATKWFEAEGPAKMSALRDRLEQTIVREIDQVTVNSGAAPRVPNTSNIRFDYIEGEAMVIALDLKGLSVSTGAACSSGAIEPSHVLTAMGLTPDQARASIRFSLGKQTAPEDIDFALERVPEVVTKLRELSPVYKR